MPCKSHLQVYFRSKVPSNVLHMVRREIELHYGLAHRNIIMLYGAFQDDKHIVLVQVGHRDGPCLVRTCPLEEALPARVHGQELLKRRVLPPLIPFALSLALVASQQRLRSRPRHGTPSTPWTPSRLSTRTLYL